MVAFLSAYFKQGLFLLAKQIQINWKVLTWCISHASKLWEETVKYKEKRRQNRLLREVCSILVFTSSLLVLSIFPHIFTFYICGFYTFKVSK